MIFFLLIVSLLLQAPTSLPTFKAEPAQDIDFMETPDNVLPGCSWYCGGFVSAFRASSELPDYKSITYMAQNAHDFNVNTAWVEGKSGHGIGEYLEYSFDMASVEKDHRLGITTLIIANGYKKSRSAWSANSRVKKLKVYLDQKPYGIVELLDRFEFQTVNIGELPLPQTGTMTLRFEILEVFPGTKYEDTAISELLFDGVGVH